MSSKIYCFGWGIAVKRREFIAGIGAATATSPALKARAEGGGKVANALYVVIEAKPDEGEEVADFLRQAKALVDAEPGTTAWFSIQLGPTTFAIFDAFPDEAGRQAHLTGKVAAALFAKAGYLLAEPPKVIKADVLAALVQSYVFEAHSMNRAAKDQGLASLEILVFCNLHQSRRRHFLKRRAGVTAAGSSSTWRKPEKRRSQLRLIRAPWSAQPRAVSRLLGREEWFDRRFKGRGVHSRSGVAETHADVISWRQSSPARGVELSTMQIITIFATQRIWRPRGTIF
jgi:quinol monooxygenase YgiN